jgi:hypothetical protein
MSRLNERGSAFRAVKADCVAVCLIGYTERVPRYMGDNRGAWPVRVATSTNPDDLARKPDQENPLHKVIVHEFVWVESDAHARRLKARMEALLLGSGEALRFSWRDCDDPLALWPILLRQALEELDMESFDDRERIRRASARALKGLVTKK